MPERKGPIEHAKDHPWEFREGFDEDEPFEDSWVSKPDKNGSFKWRKIGHKKNMIEFEKARKNPDTYTIKYDYKDYYKQLKKIQKDLNKLNILFFNCNYNIGGSFGNQACYNFIDDFKLNIVKKDDEIGKYWKEMVGKQKIIKQDKDIEYPYMYSNDGALFESIISNGKFNLHVNYFIHENFENLNTKDKNKKQKEYLKTMETIIKKYLTVISYSDGGMCFNIQLKKL